MPNYRRGACIFIDILGTRDTRGFDEKHRIHRIFHEEANEAGMSGHAHTKFSRRVISFSDCAYHFYFYRDENSGSEELDANLMYIALANASNSIMRFYSSGFIVRGGACFGEYYIDELGFFGPAVELAYKLESSCAEMPRVLIESTIGRKVFDFEREDLDPHYNLLNPSNSFFIKSDEGSYFLNEFCQLERTGKLNLRTGTISLGKLFQSLLSLSSGQIENCDSHRVREKYQYLAKKILRKMWILRSHLVDELTVALLTIPDANAEEIIEIICQDYGFDISEIFDKEDIRKTITSLRNDFRN